MSTRITGLFTGLQNATRAMQYAQFAMNVHNTNIARANDATHTRREVLTPSEAGAGGAGVKRIRDIFIDDQYRSSSSSFGFYDAKHDVLGRVEDIFGDPVDGGLRAAIDDFFDKWQALAENPNDGVARLEVLSAGRTFVQQVRSAYTQLEQVEQRAGEMMITRVDEVNRHLTEIHAINSKLQVMGPNDPEAADLKDRRDAALDELSYLTGAQGQELADGTMRVIIGGVPAVDGITISTLQVTGNPPVPQWKNFPSVTFAGRGVLGGLLAVRSGELDQMKKDIKTLAETVATRVNTIHRSGKGLGAGDPGNRDFFVMGGSPFNLANFVVNPALTPEQVAAGGSTASPDDALPSDGSVARKIGLLMDEKMLTSTIIPSQLQTPGTFYRNLVGWVGSQAREMQGLADIAETHQELNAQQRQSAWGVSLDEEVAFLTFQQKSFAAAARVFNVMDEMVELLINGTGNR